MTARSMTVTVVPPRTLVDDPCGASRLGPEPANLVVVCSRPVGHSGTHYGVLPGGGLAWAQAAKARAF